jgi:hypothetical protein
MTTNREGRRFESAERVTKNPATRCDAMKPRLSAVKATMLFVAESTGEENANLYMRGVHEGSSGELLGASELLELLDVFGEDGVRSYLVGYLEGVDDAMEEEDEEKPLCDTLG